MSIVYCKDPRRDVTYVYESFNYWDKKDKKHKAKRRCIGKLDAEGNIIPTRGHPGRPPKTRSAKSEGDSEDRQDTEVDYKSLFNQQAQRITELEALLKKKERKLEALSKGLASLVKQMESD